MPTPNPPRPGRRGRARPCLRLRRGLQRAGSGPEQSGPGLGRGPAAEAERLGAREAAPRRRRCGARGRLRSHRACPAGRRRRSSAPRGRGVGGARRRGAEKGSGGSAGPMGGCVGSHHDSSGSLNENSDGTGGESRALEGTGGDGRGRAGCPPSREGTRGLRWGRGWSLGVGERAALCPPLTVLGALCPVPLPTTRPAGPQLSRGGHCGGAPSPSRGSPLAGSRPGMEPGAGSCVPPPGAPGNADEASPPALPQPRCWGNNQGLGGRPARGSQTLFSLGSAPCGVWEIILQIT